MSIQKLNATFDPEAGAIYVYVKEAGVVARTRECKATVNLDFDKDGELIGIEALFEPKRIHVMSDEKLLSEEDELRAQVCSWEQAIQENTSIEQGERIRARFAELMREAGYEIF